MMYFGMRLKKLRTEKELTQQDLANILGVTRSTISAYETDALYPSIEVLIEISNYFQVSTDYLLGRCDQNSYLTEELTVEQHTIVEMLLEQFRLYNNRKS